jgi:hypothetical protein
MRRSAPLLRWGLIWLLTLPLLACGPQTPQDRVRALVARAKIAAEHRDAGAIYALLCEDFSDQAGMTGDDTLHSIVNYMLRNRRVFALPRLVRMDILELGEARAELYAALAGESMRSAADLDRVHADVLHLTVDLANDDEGDLCVKYADWEPATPRDMLLARPLRASD